MTKKRMARRLDRKEKESVTAQQATTQLLAWLDQQVRNAGRGDSLNELPVEPKGRFWLGRLASEEAVIESGLGERGERLDPCAVGVRLKPSGNAPWTFVVNELPVEPKGRFWLGRLASEEAVIESGLGERGERLDPCAVGVRLKPSGNAPWTFVVEVGACVWMR